MPIPFQFFTTAPTAQAEESMEENQMRVFLESITDPIKALGWARLAANFGDLQALKILLGKKQVEPFLIGKLDSFEDLIDKTDIVSPLERIKLIAIEKGHPHITEYLDQEYKTSPVFAV